MPTILYRINITTAKLWATILHVHWRWSQKSRCLRSLGLSTHTQPTEVNSMKHTCNLWFWPICSIMWDVIHKTAYNLLHCHQRRTHLLPVTRTENLAQFGHVVFELCRAQKNRQTYRNADHNTLPTFQFCSTAFSFWSYYRLSHEFQYRTFIDWLS